MRSSSIKSVVTAVAVAATLTLAVPAAEARTAQPRETVQQRDEPRGPIDRVAKAIQRFVKRLSGGVSSNHFPLPPIP